MGDDMNFLANPYFSGLQLAPSVPLSPFSVPVEQTRAMPTRPLGPVPEDDGFRPLAPADAMMFLGRSFDPTTTYRRNRLTGEIQAGDGSPLTKDAEQSTAKPDGDKPTQEPPPLAASTEDADAARRKEAEALMRAAAAKRGAAGGVDNFVRSLAQGASFGLGDEIAAAGDATVGPAVDWALSKVGLGKTNTSTAPSWSERYWQNLENERAQNKAYADAHPGWDTTGRVVGGIAGTAATLPRALLATGAGWSGLGKAGATGVGLGAINGFGEGEGGFSPRLDNAVKGALIDAASRTALYPMQVAGRWLGKAAIESGPGRYVAEKVIVPGFNVAADAADRVAARRRPTSPAGMFANVAEKLRSNAPAHILDNASARRFGNVMREGGDDAASAASVVERVGPGHLGSLNSATQRYQQRLEALPRRTPMDPDEAILASSKPDFLTSIRAAIARHDRFGNDAVRANTLRRITQGDWADDAEFLQRIAAQLSGAGRPNPNHIQRGVTAGVGSYARRQE